MSAESIREFVCSLGWKIDEAGQRRALDAINNMTKGAVAMGAALEAAAVAATAAIHRISIGLETVSWQSQRVGDSARNINAFKYAISQLGGTADGAAASIENFARKLRESPGQESVLKSWGVKTHDGSGRMRGATDLMQDLVGSQKFLSQPYYLQKRIAESSGIDEVTLRAMLRNFEKFSSEYKRIAKDIGFDPDEAGRRATKFDQAWRRMSTAIGLVGDKIADSLSDKAAKGLEVLSDFIEKHGKEIADAFSWIAGKVIDFSNAMMRLLNPLADYIAKGDAFIAKTTGIESAISKLVATLAILGAGGAATAGLRGLLGLLGVSGGAAAGMLGPLAGAAAGGLVGMEAYKAYQGTPGADEQAPSGAIEKWADKVDKGWGRVWKGRPKWLDGEGTWFKGNSTNYSESNDFYDAIIKAEGTGKRGNPYDEVLGYGKYGTPSKPLSQMTIAEVMAFGDQMRANPANPYNSSAAGAFQIVGSNLREAVRLGLVKPDEVYNEGTQKRLASWIARTQGLGAWEGFKFHPDQRMRAMRAMGLGSDRDFSSGSVAATQERLKQILPDMPRSHDFLGAAHIHGLGAIPKLSPLGHSSSIVNRNVKSNNTNNFNINNAGDAGATARAIAGMQAGVNKDLIRNMQGAAQ
jgi:hypothetical protein